MSAEKRRRRARSRKQNAPPGSPIYTGEVQGVAVRVRMLDYSESAFREQDLDIMTGLGPFQREQTVSWINLDGLHRVEEVQAICRHFNIHPLWMEDILNPHGRPKAELLDGKVLVVLKMLSEEAEPEQISIVLCEGTVLTFQERPGDVWQPLRARIRTGQGRIRRKGADYLFHALMDAVVDRYFGVLEVVEHKVDVLEDAALTGGGVGVDAIYALKSELTGIRQHIWPMREVLSVLLRGEEDQIKPENLPYFRDLSDHLVQVLELLEICRDRTMELFELRLALDGKRLNEIMQVLTIIASVFIPPTFLVGVYGMNFQHMPELAWHWGYPAVWLVMLLMAGGMIAWFRARVWL